MASIRLLRDYVFGFPECPNCWLRRSFQDALLRDFVGTQAFGARIWWVFLGFLYAGRRDFVWHLVAHGLAERLSFYTPGACLRLAMSVFGIWWPRPLCFYSAWPRDFVWQRDLRGLLTISLSIRPGRRDFVWQLVSPYCAVAGRFYIPAA